MKQDEYRGRHFKKEYKVWRILGPGEPSEEFILSGIVDACRAAYGSWDAEIKDVNGNLISYSLIEFYGKEDNNGMA